MDRFLVMQILDNNNGPADIVDQIVTAHASALRTAVAEAYEDAAVACEENASASKIVAPLTNAAYDEGCRDCAEIIRAKAKPPATEKKTQ